VKTTLETSGEDVRFMHIISTLDHVHSDFSDLHFKACKHFLHCVKSQFLSPALARVEDMDYDINQDRYNEYQVTDTVAYYDILLLDFHILNYRLVTLKLLSLLCQVDDPFVVGYMAAVKQVVDFSTVILPTESVHSVITTLIDQTCARLEELFQNGRRFSQFGAVQLEQDVRKLRQFFTDLSNLAVRQR
jgi:hypothetical protein